MCVGVGVGKRSLVGYTPTHTWLFLFVRVMANQDDVTKAGTGANTNVLTRISLSLHQGLILVDSGQVWPSLRTLKEEAMKLRPCEQRGLS